jgi:hypothetical protein
MLDLVMIAIFGIVISLTYLLVWGCERLMENRS